MDCTFTYTSQLPAMFHSIEPNALALRNGTLADNKATLWNHVLACKDQVQSDPKYKTAPLAVQQYQLEVWAHEKYFGSGVVFPGVYPILEPTPSIYPANPHPSFPLLNQQRMIPLPSHPSNPHPPEQRSFQSLRAQTSSTQTPISNPSSVLLQSTRPQSALPLNLPPTLTSQIHEAILSHKGHTYKPLHGWCLRTSLPLYTLISQHPQSFYNFCGRQENFIKTIRKRFPRYNIMYQKLNGGGIIVWVEAKGWKQVVGWYEKRNGKTWRGFRVCWNFFREWCEAQSGRDGGGKNIVAFLTEWRATMGSGQGLELPPWPEEAEVQYNR